LRNVAVPECEDIFEGDYAFMMAVAQTVESEKAGEEMTKWQQCATFTPTFRKFSQVDCYIAFHERWLPNVEMIRVNDGAARAPHETCLRQTPDPMIGSA
jgi:hypothetical protein